MAWTPKPDITVAEAAWAAGIIDGEGSIAITVAQGSVRQAPEYRNVILRVHVGNTDRRMVEQMLAVFGGNLAVDHRDQRRPYAKPLHQWNITGTGAAHVVRTVLPYLVVKGEQAAIALRFAETILPQRGSWGRLGKDAASLRHELHQQMKLLNAKSQPNQYTMALIGR